MPGPSDENALARMVFRTVCAHYPELHHERKGNVES